MPAIDEGDASRTDAGDATSSDPDSGVDAATPPCSLRVAIDDGAEGSKEVYTFAIDGTDRIPIAANASDDFAVTGGRGQVAFTTNRDGRYQVYRAAADGSGVVNLTMSMVDEYLPAFSPDGSRVAFSANQRLRVMNADGSDPITVANGNCTQPRWSSDGTKLVFVLRASLFESDAWVVNVNGTGLRQLTNLGGNEESPSWSPDGQKVVFQNSGDIHVINVNGMGRVNLTNDPTIDQLTPEWSPDGSRILFSEAGDIKSMAPNGGTRTPLSTGTFKDLEPKPSPDGSRILFVRQSSDGFVRYAVVANGDGSDPKSITGPASQLGTAAWVSCP